MVDFQSRDTDRRRSTSDTVHEDGDADSAGGETESDAPAEQPDGGSDDIDSSGDGGTTDTTAVSAAVVTVSDSRSHDDDPAGEAVVDAFESAGHDVATREVLRTAHDSVQQTVDTLVRREDVSVVVTVGGTGVGPRDVTVDAVRPIVDRELPGFGELFRRRYAEQVGTDAIQTRATAGIAEATLVFCLPGDAEAARLGVGEIVVEQAGRLTALAAGDEASDQ